MGMNVQMQIKSSNNKPEAISATNPLPVSFGSGQGFNREADAAQIVVLNAQSVSTGFTWPEGSRPTSVTIKPIGGAVWVAFDPGSEALGTTWCGGADGIATDSQRYLIPEYIPEHSTTEVIGGTAGDYADTKQPTGGDNNKQFTSGLSDMYIMEFNTNLTALIIEAS